MKRRHISLFFQRCGGVVIAVTGLALVVNTLPIFLWPLLLGMVLIWIGWRLYAVNNY